MFFVYLLKSKQRNWHYVGLTSNLERRLKQHNLGLVRSSKSYLPFDLLYKRQFPDRISARDFEKFLKIRSNKEKLLKSLK